MESPTSYQYDQTILLIESSDVSNKLPVLWDVVKRVIE